MSKGGAAVKEGLLRRIFRALTLFRIGDLTQRQKAMPVARSHRACLEAAVASLPTADNDSWSVPVATCKAAGLADDVKAARSYVLQFSLWARDAIGRLPPADPDAMEATDFNDYYKIVMSRVQMLYAQALSSDASSAPTLPICCFQTQLRRRPAFRKGGVDSCSGVFDLKGSFTPVRNACRHGYRGRRDHDCRDRRRGRLLLLAAH